MEQATAPTVSMEKALMQELVAQPQALLFNKQGFTVKDILKWYSENGYPAPNKVPKDEIPTEFLLPAEAPTVLLTGALPSMTEQQGMSSQSSQDTGFKLGKVDIPSWDGSESRWAKYKLDAKRLQSSLPVKDHQYISARLLMKLTGNAQRYPVGRAGIDRRPAAQDRQRALVAHRAPCPEDGHHSHPNGAEQVS